MAKPVLPEFLLFDLGNVLYDLDIPATRQALGQLTRGREEDLMAFLHRESWLERYETGALSDEMFVRGILSFAPSGTPEKAVIQAWNAMLVGMPAERLHWLAGLRRRFRIGLLSNTNALHLAAVRAHLREVHRLDDFEERFFDAVFYSHEIGIRKPEESCFRYALEQIGLPASGVLFMDDMPENTAAARSVGLKAVTHQAGHEIRHALDGYLLQGEALP